jgi:hypothetical protein
MDIMSTLVGFSEYEHKLVLVRFMPTVVLGLLVVGQELLIR